MKKAILFLIGTCLTGNFQAQLKCKTQTISDQTVTTCLHQSGEKSTLESWSKDKREGKIQAYDKKGKELFYYSLRTFGGHASAHLTYHTNGQVAKVEFSSAPDGGIQFYQETRKFNENGEQTDYWKMEHPFTLTELMQTDPVVKRDTVKTYEKKTEAFVPHQTIYKVINTTNKKLTLDLQGQNNAWIKLENKELSLDPDQEITLDTISLLNHHLEVQEGYVFTLAAKNKKAHKYQLILAQPSTVGQRKEYLYLIIKRPFL